MKHYETRGGYTTGMTLSAETLADYVSCSRREWLSTNGTGSFASGTVAGVATRGYHALLTAALRPPTHRMVLLSCLHETVTMNGVAYDLHTGRYADGTLHPQGWHYITAFDSLPVPTWQFDFPNGLRIIKRIFLAPGKNTVYVTYARVGGVDVDLTLAPLVAWKDYHHQMRPWDDFPARHGFVENGYQLQATPDAPMLRLLLPGAKWSRAGWWHRNNFHEREAERGQDPIEHLYCPASATIALHKAIESVTFIATIEPEEPRPASLVIGDIVRRQNELVALALRPSSSAPNSGGTGGRESSLTDLVLAADQFVVRGDGVRTTILAGYPWFTDWGRDTFIALPGICLATRRFDVAREILTAFAGYVSQGMIPNRFPDAGEDPDYNTVDATLWFVHACGAYEAATGDGAFRDEIAPVLRDIISWHVRGTRYGICMDPEDGLLLAGEAGTQLTWMDAKVGDYVVTPRIGKAVEINALWIHALTIAWDLLGEETHLTLMLRAAESFRSKFVRPDGSGLYDVIAPDGTPDRAIRPNQIIAAAVTTHLSREETRSIVDTVTRELLTPYGLRTLAPSDPAYRPRYEGNGFSRDTAYHQGTVWPWLLGPYADARRNVYGDTVDLSPVMRHLGDYGVGGIAEVFDASEPQHPNGCPWQAWSVAEVLRTALSQNK
ncbi:MAG: glycogen debranching enzyme family protein [Fibrella sp.]|nr:glycogen debranching enzyme family protein [Armatimonadota bacterium]